jgi:CheY-like chemotaxis protein
MPVLDGLEATKKIRGLESDSAAKIPIVALTAHSMSGDRERFLEFGMDDYSSKPFNAEELIETIERVVQNRNNKQN